MQSQFNASMPLYSSSTNNNGVWQIRCFAKSFLLTVLFEMKYFTEIQNSLTIRLSRVTQHSGKGA